MKHTLLLVAVMLTIVSQAQIVQSGFENWTGGAPDGWMGIKSNIPAGNVTQVTENVHGGLSAVNLHVVDASHKRFTTQPVTVANNVEYTVSYWVRGVGNIRSGLYDGRTASSGYAPYNDYVAATSTWTQVTQTLTAATDATNAEFILSVQGSDTQQADVVVDDVTITAGNAIAPIPIHDIQYTTDPSGDSPLLGQVVLTGGIVTAFDTITSGSNPQPENVYYLQDATGPWNGIYVYDYVDSENHPQIGDSIIISASVDEYFGLTELSGIASYTLVQSGLEPHAPLDILTGELSSEALESVLVRVSDAECTEAPSGANYGKWKADDGSGYAVIAKDLYTITPVPVLGQVYNVIGVVSFGFDEYDIQPRMASDVEMATDIADAGVLSGVTLGPNPATDILNVDLGQAAGSTMDYTLTDMEGRTVQAGRFTSEYAQINVGNVAEGFYHLTLRSNALVKTFAVQVAH